MKMNLALNELLNSIRRALVIGVVTMLLWSGGLRSALHAQPAEKGLSLIQSSNQVAEVVRRIASCPDWTRMSKLDQGAGQQLIQCLEMISSNETPVLRAAFDQLVRHSAGERATSMKGPAKLFLLNRYIFEVPGHVDRKEARSFGGWVQPESERANFLWPFRRQANSKLELIDTFHGYFGEEYAALREFDYFNLHFGRRRLSQIERGQ